MSELTLLSGSNATGKSSMIQSILMAHSAWNEAERKRIYTRNIWGNYMGKASIIGPARAEHINHQLSRQPQSHQYLTPWVHQDFCANRTVGLLA